MNHKALRDDILADKRVLVTGGGSGLGLQMAKRFLELGAVVAICGRSQERLDKAKESLSDFANRLYSFQTDVREHEEVEKLFDKLQSACGGINCLVNNAAGNFYCASEDLSPNAFRSVVDIVLQGSFNCTQRFGRELIARDEQGAIVNIVTTYAESGSAFVLPSACAKAGVLSMTRSLAYEWSEYGIRLNAIAPGPIPTDGAWERLMPKSLEDSYRKSLPTKRFGTPEELAELASYLLSDSSAYISGAYIPLDGAEHLKGGQFNFLTQMMSRKELKALFGTIRTKA